MRLNILSCIIILFLASCKDSHIYEKYEKVPDFLWNEDKPLEFGFRIDDTTSFYNVFINIRNSGEYPYSNLWFLIEKSDPDGNKIFARRYEFILASPEGKWLGKGIGDIFDNHYLLEEKIKFRQTGQYQYQVYQNMRLKDLPGIMDVGIDVQKAEN